MLKKHALLLSPDSVGGGSAVAVPPAPTTATPPPAPPAPSGGMFEELDAMAAPKKPEPKPEPNADKPADAPTDKKPDKPVEEPKEKPVVPKEDRAIETPKGLREAHKKAAREAEEWRSKHDALETKIKEFEAKGKDTTKLSERLTELEKERDDFKSQVRALRFEASDEFKAKFEKPFQSAANAAKKLVEDLFVTETNSEGETSSRKAGWDDFTQLYAMPISKSIPLAKKLFGDTADVVIQELRSLQILDRQRGEALEEERTQYKQREAADHAKQIKDREDANKRRGEIEKLWVDKNKEVADKHPEYFQPDPKDKEAAAILAKSFEVLDQRYGAKDLPIEKQVEMDAQIRNRAAAHPLMIYKLNQASARIAELEGIVAELKGSEPSPGDGKPSGAPRGKTEKSFDEELAELKV